MATSNTLLLGSSPNALVAATRLAQAGRRVTLLEPHWTLGGPLATVEFSPGFKAQPGLMTTALAPAVSAALGVRPASLALDQYTAALPDGGRLTLTPDPAASAAAIAALSVHDADAYPGFMALLTRAADVLRQVYAAPPPRTPHVPAEDMGAWLQAAATLRGYGPRAMLEVVRLLFMGVRDLVEEWFEHPAVQGALGALAIRGLRQGPFAAGSVFNLVHHLAIGDGYFRATAPGGLSGLVNALADAASVAGVDLRTGAAVAGVSIRDEAVAHVRLEAGARISAKLMLSDYDLPHTVTRLIEPGAFGPEFNRAVRHLHHTGCVARVNLALRGLPAGALAGTLVQAPSINALERAFDTYKHGQLPELPYVEALVPTLTDPSLAPDGQHVLSAWLQYVPRGLATETVAAWALNQLECLFPGVRDLVIAQHTLTPDDMARELQLTGGHLYGGEVSLAQSFFLRPLAGQARYHLPLDGLFLCGSAAHPAGYSGLSGLNAAEAAMRFEQ
jgi:phytoene dehydrogenase-like protein